MNMLASQRLAQIHTEIVFQFDVQAFDRQFDYADPSNFQPKHKFKHGAYNHQCGNRFVPQCENAVIPHTFAPGVGRHLVQILGSVDRHG